MSRLVAVLSLACASAAALAGDRLVVTGGAQQIEGAAGSGLVPWALIAGYGTRDQVGGSAFFTRADTDDFDLESFGAAVGIHDRLELSFSRQRFDAGSVVPGLVLRTDTVGAKVRLAGDAIYDQDRWMPQVAFGLMYKHNRDATIPRAVGAAKGSDVDYYLAATKVWLGGLAGRNLLLNGTLRYTRANQYGLLGFGGDKEGKRTFQPEVAAAVMLTDNLAAGLDWRWKPDNLSAFKEEDAGDVFLAWFPNKYTAITVAYVDLGVIAGKPAQKGGYLSLQLTY